MSKNMKPSASKPSRISGKPSKSAIKKGTGKPGEKKREKEKKVPHLVPAFGIQPKKKEVIDWEVLKEKTKRRQSPDGEDIKEIRKILKELANKKIPVHDFVTLVSPYTADNGSLLRTTMAEDVTSFQNIARKVYETMTQDVSDVLVNEQLHMMQYYQERYDYLSSKIMKTINEIYEMAPDFDFDKYKQDKEEYLNKILPLPEAIHRTAEDIEMQKRQEAYHRLQWLRSEGDRMNEENKRLQERLEQLKEQQTQEQIRATEAAEAAEARRQELTKEENQVKGKLDKLNESVEKSFIEQEANISKQHNAMTGAIKKQPMKKTASKKKKRRPEWVSETAKELEENAIEENIINEAEIFTSTRRGGDTSQQSQRRGPPRERSPFHFSPDYGVPQQQQPPRERLQETRIEEAQAIVQQKRPSPTYRPGRPPRDSWGGFY